jgi:hypothetical protein
MKTATILTLSLLAGTCGPALATTFSNDVTDLWWNPDESGWGVNLIQQSNVVFATFFVYDSLGQPHWYVASDMRAENVPTDRPYEFSGALYETTGPAFSAPVFNPAAVTRRQVGSANFEFIPPDTGTLTYSVDGVSVTKQVRRQTWAANDPSGQYTAAQVTQKSPFAAAGCNAPTGLQTFDQVAVALAGNSFTMTASRVSPSGGRCQYAGTYSQAGHMGAVDGAFTCDGGSNGTFTLRELEVGVHGFAGNYDASDRGCQVYGNFAAVRANGNDK